MKPNRAVSMPRGGRLKNRDRRPFWLPAVNYYILTAFVTIVFFFIILAVMSEGDDENYLGGAFLGAGFILGGAVLLREVVLRSVRQRYLATQKQLDSQIEQVFAKSRKEKVQKITLEQNAAILKEIKNKSNAAKVLGKFPETHREVFEVCNEYLSLSKIQLNNVGPGSPRLAAFRNGRELVKKLHRYHLLEWTQAETRNLTQDAKISVKIDERINAAQKALKLIEKALLFYPSEPRLTESEIALKEFVSSLQITDWMEKAENAKFTGDYSKAAGFFRNALFLLEHSQIQNVEKEIIAEKIKEEIAKIPRPDRERKETFSAVPQDLEDIYD